MCKSKVMYGKSKRVVTRGLKLRKDDSKSFWTGTVYHTEKSTVAQKDPPQMINKLVAYIIHVCRLVRRRFLWNLNEYCHRWASSMIWYVLWYNCWQIRKERYFNWIHGYEKVCVLVCLVAQANGMQNKNSWKRIYGFKRWIWS